MCNIECQRVWFNIYQNWDCMEARNNSCRSEERVGRHDDFIARTYAERHEGNKESICTARDRDCMANTEIV